MSCWSPLRSPRVSANAVLKRLTQSLVTGTPAFPPSEIPFQATVDRVADGNYEAKPAKVFHFDQIQEAHRLIEGDTSGKLVVTLSNAAAHTSVSLT